MNAVKELSNNLQGTCSSQVTFFCLFCLFFIKPISVWPNRFFCLPYLYQAFVSISYHVSVVLFSWESNANNLRKWNQTSLRWCFSPSDFKSVFYLPCFFIWEECLWSVIILIGSHVMKLIFPVMKQSVLAAMDGGRIQKRARFWPVVTTPCDAHRVCLDASQEQCRKLSNKEC